MTITLVGVGMGAPGAMTIDAREALARADIILGAERLLAALPPDIRGERIPLPLPEKVAAAVAAHPEWRDVCVVLSGDIGFYSGAKRLLDLLAEYNPVLVPGLSTPQYFAARLRRPWQDMRLASAHGVRCDILAEALNHRAVLFLAGGDATPTTIAAALCEAGLDDAMVTVGENLSMPDERIVRAAAGDLAGMGPFASLCAVLVENDQTFARDVRAPGIPDDDFIRGATPMTKRETRVLALSLLNPKPADIVYDVGAGTGSVAVETALLARRGRVFAIERDDDALDLIGANREKFGVYNVIPVAGAAPEALAALPPPDAAFVGGSGGALRDIVGALLAKNPAVRLVVGAIALETLSTVMAAMEEFAVRDVEVVQAAASRAVVRGGYHMLEARNPVFLVAGGGP